jgi:hypothetical protein
VPSGSGKTILAQKYRESGDTAKPTTSAEWRRKSDSSNTATARAEEKKLRMAFSDREAEGSSTPAPRRSRAERLHREKIRPWQRQQNTDPVKQKHETVVKTESGNGGGFC